MGVKFDQILKSSINEEKPIEGNDGEIFFSLRKLSIGQNQSIQSPTYKPTYSQQPVQIKQEINRWIGKLSISEGNTKIPICQIVATSIDNNKKFVDYSQHWPSEILIENKLPKLKPTINAIISEETNLSMFQFNPSFEDNQKKSQYRTILQKMNEKDLVRNIYFNYLVFTCNIER